uniref:Uncharacterized protein n=1 Tax=Acrobeloides nanus TaxID=290746 RepID=A0A914EF61_9BILA
MTKFTENYLLWHHLGHHLYVCPREEIDEFRVYFEDRPNPVNVAAFIDSYLNRSDIEINKHPCKVPVLQIVGERSAFVQDAEDLHMKLSPMATEFLKLSGCGGNVLNEKPAKVTEALLLFLQGVGLVPWLDVHESVKKISEKFVQKSSL